MSSNIPDIPNQHCRRRQRRSAATAVAFLAVLHAATSSTTANASPLPIPFLDFLYPTFQALKPYPALSNTRQSPPSRSQPGRSDTTVARNPTKRNNSKKRSSTSTPSLVKRDTSGGRVPTKYEYVREVGWVEADSWRLHGRGDRSGSTIIEDTPSGIDGVQNLDTTDPVNGSNIDATDPLDLPPGWHQDHLARHENYDPAIVTVFAVILVCAILATIGLCRWRTRKLRRLKDLEQLERKRKGEEDSDTETMDSTSVSEDSSFQGKKSAREKRGKAGELEKEGPHKGSKSTGKSNAFRKANDRIIARLRRRYRSKAAATDHPPEAGNPVTENNTNTPALAITIEETSENAPSTPVHSPNPLNNTRHEDTSPRSPNLALDEAPPSTTDSTETSSLLSAQQQLHDQLRPSTPTTSNERQHGESSVPTTSPPAYLGAPFSMTSRNEKTPLRGLEDDYDERDLASFRASHGVRARSSQRRSRRNAASSSIQDPIHSVEIESHYSDTIPDEPLPPIDAAIRVAAGATRQAHLATDDKAVLERLRNLADEPLYVHLPGHSQRSPSQPASSSQDADQPVARAPEWNEMDRWHMEQQIQEHAQSEDLEEVQSSVHAGSSSKNILPNLGLRGQPSSSITLFPALPPPPTLSFISQSMIPDGEVSSTHTLGQVWNQLQSGSSLSASELEPQHMSVPSAPDSMSMLLPSAPPCLEDEEAAPSAPPIWDDAEDEEAGPSGEERSSIPSIPSIPSTSAAHSSFAHGRSDTSISDRGPDGSSSEEEGSNSQWPASLRTTRREGAGLPKYEP